MFFAHVIKLKSGYPGLGWVLNPIRGVHKEEEKTEIHREGHRKTKQILDKPKNVKDCQEALESRKRQSRIIL